MTRTSISHPLQIAAVDTLTGHGRIGITFCPGKVQASAATGAWNRDLLTDVKAIADWGAAAVLTLVEDHELVSLEVEGLGATVAGARMDWLHAPIPDVSVPDAGFEAAWVETGEGLRDRLRAGFDILVHCKGGLGRAGMIAARLLVELGIDAETAITRVRQARPGAIETSAQEAVVRRTQMVPERQPGTAADDIRDRARGALFGLAVGDALGTTLEFKARDTYEPLTDLVGGGPFRLKPGQWTDDTAMALALADSLAAKGGLDEQDLLARFHDWWQNGTYSCTGRCFDIGVTTAQALSRWKATGKDHCGSIDPQTAGNGSLMRLGPVAIRFRDDRSALRDAAARQSKTTHAAVEAVDACVLYAEMMADAINGAPRSEVLKGRPGAWASKIDTINQGSWRGLGRTSVNASGYVAHSLEAALWATGRTARFDQAVLLAANLGQDADTTAAIVGQLAGALAGASGITADWLAKLAWRDRITAAVDALLRLR
ncbi:ADP-ribosylglycohydrolase family protein [uncultured Brevundimonas sp.]|uniref:ADP-ribosylglycohydrolase family protein n=1 Tax=uncultured Brevundimonas sp. TaxID=213418 RepID=UPI0025FEDA88|nr:ADP-ribosylglycohydrolase family protein [uncultured Brevundimonas sp.]